MGEFVGAIAEALLDGTSRNRKVPYTPPPEGDFNASLGCLTSFVAGIGALFCGAALWAVWQSKSDVPLVQFFVGTSVVAIGALFLARRAFRLTKRNRALVLVGIWLACATIVGALVGVVLLLRRG